MTTVVVVDASVAVKWLVPEEGAEQARPLLSSAYRLIAPGLLCIEVASVAWKLVRRGLISKSEAESIVGDLASLPVELFGSVPLLPGAIRIANAFDRTVFDSLYLALSEQENARFVTCDRRLKNALGQTRQGKRTVLLADFHSERA